MSRQHGQDLARRRKRRGISFAMAALAAATLLVLLVPPGSVARTQIAPANTTLPAISGSAVKSSTLSSTSGSWSGTAPIAFTYSWRRCDGDGANCAAIGGATAATYLVVDSDVGHRLRVQVTATNDDGTATALSAATVTVVAAGKPVNTAEPRINGTAAEGQTLSATSGSWTGAVPIAYGYQWVRCGTDGGNATGSNCLSIPGGTKATFKLDDDDIGRRLRVRVTATNGGGATTVASDATKTVTASSASGPPVNSREPAISGTARQGQTLTASPGTWTGAAPLSFTYQWVQCGSDGGRADGSNCPSVSGATKSTYTLSSSDVGKRIRVRVTAKNSSGSKTAASNPTSPVGVTDPAGTITLSNGEKSVTAMSVPATSSLVVDQVRFSPNPVRSRNQAISVRVKVKDTRGYVVRDALVFIRSTPKVTSGGDNARTGTDGWLTYTLTPERDFPVRAGYSVQFYVKAYRTGDPTLGGVSGTRLVQVATAP